MLTKSEDCLYQDLLEGFDEFYLNSIIPDRVSCEEWQKLWQTYKYSSWGKWTTGFFYETSSNTTLSFYKAALAAEDDQQRANIIRKFLSVTRFDERQKFKSVINDLKNIGVEVTALTASGVTAVITIPGSIILAVLSSIEYGVLLYISDNKNLAPLAVINYDNHNYLVQDSLSVRMASSAFIGIGPPCLVHDMISAKLYSDSKPEHNILGFYKFLWEKFEKDYQNSEPLSYLSEPRIISILEENKLLLKPEKELNAIDKEVKDEKDAHNFTI